EAIALVALAWSLVTEQSLDFPPARLVSYLQPWVLPSSVTETVTRSHQEALDVRVEVVAGWVEAEAKARAAIAGITSHSYRAPRSVGLMPMPPARPNAHQWFRIRGGLGTAARLFARCGDRR